MRDGLLQENEVTNNFKANFKQQFVTMKEAVKQPRPFPEPANRNKSPRVIHSATATFTGQGCLWGRGKNTVIGAYHRDHGFPAGEGRVNLSVMDLLHGSKNMSPQPR